MSSLITDFPVLGEALETAKRVGSRHRICFLPSVTHIPAAAWERMFPGDPECWDFYRTAEQVPPPGFSLSAVAAYDGHDIVAAAPVFQINYRLDTPLQGRARVVGDWLYRRWPGLVSRSVMGLGSPMSDSCTIGFAPGLSVERRQEIFSDLLDMLRERASERRISVLAIKSLGRQAADLHQGITRSGYHRVTNLPIVALPAQFRDFDHYLQSLPKKTRAYLRRKMRPLSELRIEHRTSARGLESKLFELFENTRRQSKGSYGEFEALHPDIFTRALEELGDKADIMLCWRGDELMSFLFMLVGSERIIGKYIGMNYPDAKELNLYFIMALKMIEMAIARNIPIVEMGVTTYPTKLLFGGHLERRWLYFQFVGAMQDAVISPFAFLFDFERNDAELRQLNVQVRS